MTSQVNVIWRPLCLEVLSLRFLEVLNVISLFIAWMLCLIEFSLTTSVDQEALVCVQAHRDLAVNREVVFALLYVIKGNDLWLAAEASVD